MAGEPVKMVGEPVKMAGEPVEMAGWIKKNYYGCWWGQFPHYLGLIRISFKHLSIYCINPHINSLLCHLHDFKKVIKLLNLSNTCFMHHFSIQNNIQNTYHGHQSFTYHYLIVNHLHRVIPFFCLSMNRFNTPYLGTFHCGQIA
jgi:hypothetical protein